MNDWSKTDRKRGKGNEKGIHWRSIITAVTKRRD